MGVDAAALHGGMSQRQRERALAEFKAWRIRALVCPDVAARGIHVDDVAFVIHADPPEEHKAFLHRSGRTARAGAAGTVITMVTENQRRHVKRLAQDAGIEPTNTKVAVGHELLTFIAPGEREFKEMPDIETPKKEREGGRKGGPRNRDGRGSSRGPAKRSGGPAGRGKGKPSRSYR